MESTKHRNKSFIFSIFMAVLLVLNSIPGGYTAYAQSSSTITICVDPHQDAFINHDHPEENKGDDNDLKVKPDSGKENRVVIGFDLASIPTNATVISARLRLYEDSKKDGQTITLHRLTNNWVESQVTWNQRSNGASWATAGGDFEGSPLASFRPDVDKQYREIDVTGVTQGWVDGSFNNFGLLLLSSGKDGEVKFKSREESNPDKNPELCVTYQLPPGSVPPALTCVRPIQDAFINHDKPTENKGGDNDLKVKPDSGKERRLVIGFDLASIPSNSTVLSAKLRLYEDSKHDGQTITLHRLTNNWVESQVTWNNRANRAPWTKSGGDFDVSPLASFSPDVDKQYRELDVTGVTQGWVDGSLANFGLLLLSTGQDGEVKFKSREEGNPDKNPELCVTYQELPANQRPQIAIDAPADGSTFNVGDNVSFSGSASDPEDGDLTAGIAWKSNLNETIGTGGSFSTSVLSVGVHTITASVTDSGGLTANASITVTIQSIPNQPPQITISSPVDGSTFLQGDSVSFSGAASDPEDGDLTANITWDSDLDGFLGTEGAFSRSDLTLGKHVITARVADSGGLTTVATTTIVIQAVPNQLPQVTISSPANGSTFDQGVSISFSGTASDPEDGDLTAGLAWVSNLDGSIGSGGSFDTSSLSVGSHTVTASITDSGGLTASAVVSITIASVPQDVIFADGFESGDLSTWSSSLTRNGLLSVSTEVPLIDSYSLKAIVIPGNTVYVTDDSPNAEQRYRARFYFDPNSLTMTNPDGHYILTGASGSAFTTVLRVEFRSIGGEYQLRTNHLLSNSVWNYSSWFPISDGPHFIELDWRAASAPLVYDGGLTLWIDGVQKADLTSRDNPWPIDRVQLGAVSGIDAGTDGTYYFDAFESRQQTYIGPVLSGTNHPPLVTISAPADGSRFNLGNTVSFSATASDIEQGDLSANLDWTSNLDGPIGNGGSFSKSDLTVGTHTITASVTDSGGLTASASITISVTDTPQDLIFADGFESGDLSAWSSSVTRNGLLSVTSAGALVDNYGLQAIVSQGNTVYVTDEGPNAEPRYRARFYFDPNSLTMGNGESHYIFIAASDAPLGGTVFRIHFRFMDGEYQIRTNHLLSDGTTFNYSNWFTISDALHFIELDWRAASSPGANDGGLTFWIDGVQKADFAGIDNAWPIDRVQLGAVSGIDAGTTGTYYFDAFESRKDTYIGPVTSGTNHPPLVTIIRPYDGSTYNVGNTVNFSGTASDIENGDLTAGITWLADNNVIGTGSTFSKSDLSVGIHTITASITDGGGLTSVASTTITVFAETAVLVGAGDIADDRDYDEATATLLETIPGTVVTLGDNAYPNGTIEEYNAYYDPTWGRHKARTMPASGNHEYYTPGATGYYDYFGAAAGDPTKGYYSYDVGDWHIITLNTECSYVGGCGSADPQGQWLQADLAANQNACTLAVLHKPLFSSGSTSADGQAYWELLYQAGADVILSGHAHVYERFAPQDPYGVADPRGIREFVVGTGGGDLHNPGPLAPNTEVREITTHGVLKLTLQPTSYSWQFVPIAGKSFTDSGSSDCVEASSGPVTILDANFNTNADGFSYSDDTFRGTNQPSYASGARIGSGGYTGGALQVTLGGINNNTIQNMSGGWRYSFNLSAPTNVNLSLRYNLSQAPNYESDEFSQALVSVDGVLYGTPPNSYMAQIAGNGNGGSTISTGWQLFQVNLGTLSAGNHTLTIGGFNNKKTYNDESTTVLIDDVLLLGTP